jgi:ElaB/YqjD/DUF883 family membrane-anchored ribosome-binding protein
MVEGNDLIRQVDVEATDRSAEAIRRDIALHRDSISDTVDELNDRVQAALDWRTYIAEHPFIAVGVAAGLTCTVAAFIKRRSSPQDRIMDALAETVEDVAGRFRDGLGALPLIKRARMGHLLWSLGSTIVTAAISKKLRDPSIQKDTPTEHRDEQPNSFAARANSRGQVD